MEQLLRDVRMAGRALWRQQRFLWIAALTIGLGIGLNTSVFSVVSAAMLRPLPYPSQDQLLQIHNSWEGSPVAGLSPAEYLDYDRDRGQVFSAFGVYAFGTVSLAEGPQPVSLRAGALTVGAAQAFGVVPIRGRWFTAEEERTNEAVALISEGVWRAQFGSDAAVLERDVTMDGAPTRVVGILPANFRLPEDFQTGSPTQVFAPLGIAPTASARGSHFLSAIGRLTPGVTAPTAEAALRTSATRFVADFPNDYPAAQRFAVHAVPLAKQVQGDVGPVLALLLGAAGIVLLVTCATVGNLLLVRLDGRRGEITIRTALGASRFGLMRYVLLESLLLAGAGAVVGLAITLWAMPALTSILPRGLPVRGPVGLDPTVMGFGLLATLVTGLLVTAIPAAVLGKRRGDGSLRCVGRGTIEGAGEWPRRILVGGQVMLALLLLAGAGALGRSLLALRGVDPGFSLEGSLTAQLALPPGDYPDAAAVVNFVREVDARLANLPGVAAVGAVTRLPLASTTGDLNFRIEGRVVPEGESSPRADWQVATPGYLQAMGLRLREGRFLESSDDEAAAGVVVINHATATRYWPEGDALGQRFVLGGRAGPGVVTVIGIVDDVRHASLSEPAPTQMYLAHAQFRFWNGGGPARTLTIVLRPTSGDPVAFTPMLRAAVKAVDPRLPLADVRPMREVMVAAVSQERMLFTVAGVFAGLSLVLGALGIYGVVAYSVARRTREIGVRIALGAQGRSVVGMVVTQGGRPVLAGLLAGLFSAFLLGSALDRFLYEVKPLDPLTLFGAAAVLVAVAALAMYLPARRASRVNPTEALRHE